MNIFTGTDDTALASGDDWFNHYTETPQQEFERFKKDYHALDREAVLAAKAQAAGVPYTTTGSQNQNTVWNEASFSAQFGRPGTPQDLIALESRLQAAGIKVLRNAAGVAGKVQLPNGKIVDVINAAGAGGRGFQWLEGDDGGGGELGSGYFTKPYGVPYTGGTPIPNLPTWEETFKQPTLDEIRNMPGYQFTRDEGIRALDAGAASRGTVANGGQKLDLANYVTGLADQFAQRGYDNKLGEYKTNFDVFRSENSDRFARSIQGRSSALDEYLTLFNVDRSTKNDIFGRYDTLAARGIQAAGAATS